MNKNLTASQRKSLTEIAAQPRPRRNNRSAVTDDSLLSRGLVSREERPLGPDFPNVTHVVLVVTEAGREALGGVPAGLAQSLRDAEREALAPYREA